MKSSERLRVFAKDFVRSFYGRAAIAVACVLVWQATFLINRHQLPVTPVAEIVGLQAEAYKHFIYFYHHFNVFPVAIRGVEELPQGRQAAEKFVAEHGKDLVNDLGSGASKIGDYGKIFLYYPDVWFRADPQLATGKTFLSIFFLFSLCALAVAFVRARRLGLGAICILFLGSHPFQLGHAYNFNNVFSLPASVAILLMALCFRWLHSTSSPSRWDWAIAVTCGVLCGFFRDVRNEAAMMILSVCGLICLQFTWDRWRRLAVLASVVGALALTQFSLHAYFDSLFHSAQEFVRSRGGNVYEGPRVKHHVFWHPMNLGRGDFDTKYGSQWADAYNYRYVTPLLQSRYGMKYTWEEGRYFFHQAYDKQQFYLIQPEDIPETEILLRERYINMMLHDPLWYAGLIAKRVWRVISETSPVGIAVGTWRLDWQLPGYVLLLLFGLLVWRRESLVLRLTIFTAPLSIVCILVYSGGNQTRYSLFPCLLAAGAAALVLRAGIWYRYQHEPIAASGSSTQSKESPLRRFRF